MRTKLLLTQIKREFWEHKTGFVYAPLLVTGLVLLILVVAAIYSREIIGVFGHENGSIQFACKSTDNCLFEIKNSDSGGASGVMELVQKRDFESIVARDPEFFGKFVYSVLIVNLVLLSITYCIVLAIYTHGALLDDRKSRDILFWRSMPVSETVNVLVKLVIVIGLPPVALLLSSLFLFLCATAATAGVLSMAGAPVALVMKQIFVIDVPPPTILELVGMGLLMFLLLAPIFSYFLFCSALAKKSPVILSSVLPVGVWFLGSILADIGINSHVREVWSAYSDALVRALSSAKFAAVGWQAYLVIFAVTALFICGAIWLRNNRYEI